MKRVLFLLLAIVCVSMSCEKEKCYVCEYNARTFPDTIVVMKSETLCDITDEEARQHEQENTMTITGPDSFTYNQVMHCR